MIYVGLWIDVGGSKEMLWVMARAETNPRPRAGDGGGSAAVVASENERDEESRLLEGRGRDACELSVFLAYGGCTRRGWRAEAATSGGGRRVAHPAALCRRKKKESKKKRGRERGREAKSCRRMAGKRGRDRFSKFRQGECIDRVCMSLPVIILCVLCVTSFWPNRGGRRQLPLRSKVGKVKPERRDGGSGVISYITFN